MIQDEEAARELVSFWSLPPHENVLKLLDVFRNDKMQFLVLKLHNTTLFHAWEGKRGRVDIEKCDKYSEGMLRDLSHMHSHGLAHRDLVMLNLMLSFAGDTIEIGDFGMAHSAASFLLDRNVTQLHGRSPEVLLSAGSGVAYQAFLRAPVCG